MGAVSVIWVLCGYSMAFGDDLGGGLIGNPFEFFGLKGLFGERPARRRRGLRQAGIPTMAFVAFQAVFAIITVALISGAIADRAKFGDVAGLPGRLGDARLLPGRPLGLRLRRLRGRGRRLDRQRPAGAIDFAGGHRGAHQRRCRRPRARARARQAHRLRQGGHAAAQPAAGHARRRPAVVRLVRLQRRLGARAPTAPPAVAWVNTLVATGAAIARLAPRGEDPRRARHLARCGLRRRRRPRGHHPGLLGAHPGRARSPSASSPACCAPSRSA